MSQDPPSEPPSAAPARAGRRHRAFAFVARHAPLLVASICFAITLAIAGRMQLHLLRIPAPIGFDEGYTAALAERLIDGHWLPYVDGASHRGPLLYWLQAVAQLLGGRWEWAGTRWLAFLCFATTLIGLFGVGVAARRPLAGAIGALFYTYVVCFALEPADGLAVTGEPVAAPFSIVALLLAAVAIERVERARWQLALLAAAGAAAALAGLAKQTLLPIAGPIGLWVLAVAVAAPAWSRRRRIGALAALCGGYASMLGIVLLRYALAGRLGTFFYWFWIYNREVYVGAVIEDVGLARELNGWAYHQPWAFFAAVFAIGVTLSRAVSALGRLGKGGVARAWARSGLEATVALGALVGLLAAVAGLRLWAHYFVPCFAWFGLLLGLGAEAVVRLPSLRRRLVALPLLATLLLLWVGYCVDLRLNRIRAEQKHGGWAPARPDPLCDGLDRIAPAGESMFIWGFDGDLYLTCRRRPVSRYLYGTLVAGNVPPLWHKPSLQRSARGSQPELAHELETAAPALVLDMPARVGGVSIRTLAPVVAVLDERYCAAGQVRGNLNRVATVYRRRARGEKCAAEANVPGPPGARATTVPVEPPPGKKRRKGKLAP